MRVYIPGIGKDPTEAQSKAGVKIYCPVFTNKKKMLAFVKAERERTGLKEITYVCVNISSKISKIKRGNR